MKKIYVLLLILSLFPALNAVAGGTYHLKVGDTETLSFTPQDGILTNTVRWESNCPQQVVVTRNVGTTAWIEVVAPISGSYCIVQCRYEYVIYNGNFPYYMTAAEDFRIYVEPSEPTDISLRGSLTLNVGESATLTPTISPSDAVTQLSWSTSNGAVASVTQSGRVSGLSAGSVMITVCTDNGLSATCNVTVVGESPEPSSISINSDLALNVGGSATLTPTIYPQGAAAQLTWTTSNSAVASVSQSGKVTGAGVGEAVITVSTDNGLSDSCNVTVSINGSGSEEGEFAGGSGSLYSPYLVATAEQLSHVENHKNNYFKQICDIDLTDYISGSSAKGWLPIGANYDPFMGFYDGGGFKITGLTIERPDKDYVGLFGYVESATVENIVVDGAKISGKNYCAAVVGYAEESVLDNLRVSGNVSGVDCTGGVAGYVKNTDMSDGGFSGSVNGNDKVGGIVGSWNYDKKMDWDNYSGSHITNRYLSENEKNSDLRNFLFEGWVTGNVSVGGIVGELYCYSLLYDEVFGTGTFTLIGTLNLKLSDLTSLGNIQGSENIGGIVGSWDSIADAKAGGFEGYVTDGYTGERYYTTATSEVISEIEATISGCHNASVVYGGKNAGGILGNINMSTSTESLTTGWLDKPEANSRYEINECTSNGNVVSTGDYAGGVVGYSNVSIYSSDKSHIVNVACSPELVSANNYAGGLTGFANYLDMENSIFTGKDVVASNDFAAGMIAGSSDGVSVKSCVSAAGRISATESAGRIGYASEYENNMGFDGTVLAIGGTEVEVVDDAGVNGTTVSASELCFGNTYHDIGWNLSDIWRIREDESYPYLRCQTMPLVDNITFTGNSENVFASGQAAYTEGCVFVQEDGVIYRGEVDNYGKWTVTMPADVCVIGDELQVFGLEGENAPSYSLFITVDTIGEAGVDENMDGGKLSVYCSNGMLHIKNAECGDVYSICDISGRIIAHGVVSDVNFAVPVGMNGLFIVRCGCDVVKVVNNY